MFVKAIWDHLKFMIESKTLQITDRQSEFASTKIDSMRAQIVAEFVKYFGIQVSANYF